MKKRGRLLSLEERKLIEKYTHAGINATKIATALNRSKTCILQEFQRFGKKGKEYNAISAHELGEKIQFERTEKLKIHLTELQINKIIEFTQVGCGYKYVARAVGISGPTLLRFYTENPDIKRLANHDSPNSMLERIQILEDQITILNDLIKELYERDA